VILSEGKREHIISLRQEVLAVNLPLGGDIQLNHKHL